MVNMSLKGFACGAIAAASYGLNPLFTLPLYSAGLTPDSVLFYRYGLAMVMLGILMKVQGQSFALHKSEILPLFVMGMLMAFSSLTLFISYNYMDAGIASTILFVYPVLVAVIMALFFKEKVSVVTMVSIALAFLGISLLYKGEGGQTLSFVGVALVFVASLTYALYIIGVNRSVLRDMPTAKLTFYVLLFGVTLFVVRLCMDGSISYPDKWYLWGNLLALAIFPTAISFLCTTSAIQYIGSTPTAILGALEPVTAIIFGITVFGERMTFRESVGLVLIIVAVTMVIAGGGITQQLIRFRKMFPRIPIKRFTRR